VTTGRVGWASEEASDLVAPPLNLVLYMHLRISTLALYHRTFSAPEGYVLVLGCVLGPDEVSFADVGHPLVLLNTKGPGRIAHGWEDHYSVRPYPTEDFLHDRLFWNPLFDSSIFYRCEGSIHFTGSCLVPYRFLCQT
jgi:hypothetical protein